MPRLLTLFFFITSFYAAGQARPGFSFKELDFIGRKVAVPAGCTARSDSELKCDTYEMKWLYFPAGSGQKLEVLVNDIMDDQARTQASYEEEPIKCTLRDKPAKGFRSHYLKNGTILHQITAYGDINGQPVLFHLYLSKEARITADLPEPARHIIKLL